MTFVFENGEKSDVIRITYSINLTDWGRMNSLCDWTCHKCKRPRMPTFSLRWCVICSFDDILLPVVATTVRKTGEKMILLIRTEDHWKRQLLTHGQRRIFHSEALISGCATVIDETVQWRTQQVNTSCVFLIGGRVKSECWKNYVSSVMA